MEEGGVLDTAGPSAHLCAQFGLNLVFFHQEKRDRTRSRGALTR